MADAYFSQKGASEAAQTALGDRKNANAHVRYYEKTLVDKKQATRDAEAALVLGKAAVAKAKSNFAIAKSAEKQYVKLLKQSDKREAAYTRGDVKAAKHAAVKQSMQAAYIESSEGRNNSNVPKYGGGKLFKWRR
jgi:hypothetical protein